MLRFGIHAFLSRVRAKFHIWAPYISSIVTFSLAEMAGSFSLSDLGLIS